MGKETSGVEIPADVRFDSAMKWLEADDLIYMCQDEEEEFKKEIYETWWQERGRWPCSFCSHFKGLCGLCPISEAPCHPAWDTIRDARFFCPADFIEAFEKKVPEILWVVCTI